MGSRIALAAWGCVLALALGCAISNYPVITDDRGDYSGVIRTGHKAYIYPSFTGATLYPDGSDEIFNMVYQNAYGDQRLYAFNNYDPSGAVNFLDQTYCDWRFDDCEISRSWNPVQNDTDPFDYEFFPECSGSRSLSLLNSYGSRIGECGDRLPYRRDLQSMLEAFANLDEISWRGERAYHLPLDAQVFSASLESVSGSVAEVPVFGRYDLLVTDRFEHVIPMTPNARHQLRWLEAWVAENGPGAVLTYDYKGISGEMPLRFRAEGLAYNAGRF